MATSTITGTITDPTGVAVAGARVVCRLMPTGAFRAATGSEVARVVSTTTNASGVYTLTLEENAGITPANTWYELTEYIPDANGGTRVWNIQVGASDQTVLASLVSVLPDAEGSGYLTQAAADARYQALGGLSSSTPGTETPDHAGTAGVSSSASRADHVHPIAAAAPGTIAPDDTADEGVSTSFARADHRHAITAAAPTTVNLVSTASASEGVATSFARSDHGHVAASVAGTTWSPVVTQSNTPAQTVNWARYLRVGRQITVWFNITFNGAGTASNNIVLTALPLAAANLIGIQGSFRYFDTGNTNRAGHVRGVGTTSVVFNYDGFGNEMGNGDFAIASGDVLEGFVTYEAAT